MRAKKRNGTGQFKSITGSDLLDRLYDIYVHLEGGDDFDTEEESARAYVGGIARYLKYGKIKRHSMKMMSEVLRERTQTFLDLKHSFMENFLDDEYHASFVAMSMCFVLMAKDCNVIRQDFDEDDFAQALSVYVDQVYAKDPGKIPSNRSKVFKEDFYNLDYNKDDFSSRDRLEHLLVKLYGAFSDVEVPDASLSLKDKVAYYSSILVRSAGIFGVDKDGVEFEKKFIELTYQTVTLFVNKTDVDEDLAIFWGSLFLYHEIGVLKGVFKAGADFMKYFHNAVIAFVDGIQKARMRLRFSKQEKFGLVIPTDIRVDLVGNSSITKSEMLSRNAVIGVVNAE